MNSICMRLRSARQRVNADDQKVPAAGGRRSAAEQGSRVKISRIRAERRVLPSAFCVSLSYLPTADRRFTDPHGTP